MSCQQYILSVGVILIIYSSITGVMFASILLLKYFASEKVAFPAMLMKLVMLSALASYCELG